ncbi:MAG: two-component sensor histidine kinase [Flavobacteriales bacterium]|nr:two-component sensor histidine kinase [Flavobacteriales bacterium]
MNFTRPIFYASCLTLLIVSILLLIAQFISIPSKMLFLLIISVYILNLLVIVIFSFRKKKISNSENKKKQEGIAVKKAEKYRREFLGNVSHELKTPIFNIQGYIETLIDGALHDPKVNLKYLKRTSKSVDRLIYIIKDLESIAQLDSDEISLKMTKWNLQDLINEVVDQFEIKANKKKIQLSHDNNTTEVMVYADKDKIAQVLYNLISNSIKYGKHGGITKISCHQSKTHCLVSIKDNGIGIADKNITRLFERFYRVDKSRSREQGGTGLGLAIVKHIIEAHDQKINVSSSIGKGTQFNFSLTYPNDL